jgi:Lipocalin-like domain
MSETLLGAWKLITWYQEDAATKERVYLMGQHPQGYAVFSPTNRVSFILTAEGRKPPQSPEEQAEAYRTMVAYSGKYRIEGNKLITTVDVAWDEFRVGSDQVRFFTLDGDRLHIESAPVRDQNLTARMWKGFLVWERETASS